MGKRKFDDWQTYDSQGIHVHEPLDEPLHEYLCSLSNGV